MGTTAALARVAELVDRSRISSTVHSQLDDLDGSRDCPQGYLDLLGEAPPKQRTVALAAMRSAVLPLIYERWWRPVVRLVGGAGQAAELRLAAELLNVQSGQTVLDLACGPGNFTRSFAAAAGPDGLVVGVDESATMLARAVEQTGDEWVGYVRGDARDLPFAGGTFDAVGCFLALHLVPEPFRAVHEMIRLLAPGGRIALSAPYRPAGVLPRVLDRMVNAPLGLRAFGRTELTDVLTGAGLVDIRQQVRGLYQFVGAVRPA
ncbi:MAG: methyltransferase domain-containing protein [Labedaea sp.]